MKKISLQLYQEKHMGKKIKTIMHSFIRKLCLSNLPSNSVPNAAIVIVIWKQVHIEFVRFLLNSQFNNVRFEGTDEHFDISRIFRSIRTVMTKNDSNPYLTKVVGGDYTE